MTSRILDDRARPPVGEDERQGVRLGRAHVEEVDVLPVDRGRELRVLVEPRLPGAPVVAAAPVVGELLDVGARHAVAPPGAGQLVGPARARETLVEVVQHGLGDLDPERSDLGVGHAVDGTCECGQVLAASCGRLVPCSPRPRACSTCCRCCSRAGPGAVPSSPSGQGWACGRSAATSTGCVASATRSTRSPAPRAATGSGRAPPCPRSCSTTRRRWPSPSGCGRRRAAP